MYRLLVLIAISSITFSCVTNESLPRNDKETVSESTKKTENEQPSPEPSASEEKKGHVHEAPRGGTLVAFGEEFAHLELVLDQGTGKITAYVLDGEAEKAIQIKQEELEIEIEKPKKLVLTLKAVESALTGEKVGNTSEFSTQSDELKGLKEFDANVSKITVKGKEFKKVEFEFPEGNEHQHEH